MFFWVGTIHGAKSTVSRPLHTLMLQVYESLVFKLSLSFPSDYPYSAPTVRFDTPCYHPNVDQSGNICLDILKVLLSGLS